VQRPAAQRRQRLAARAVKTATPITSGASSAPSAAEELDSAQIASLLKTLTQPDMEIAELSLKMGDLQLRVRRSTSGGAAGVSHAAAPALAAPPAMAAPTLQPALALAPAPYVRCGLSAWAAADGCTPRHASSAQTAACGGQHNN
jgi:hypothetical protein